MAINRRQFLAAAAIPLVASLAPRTAVAQAAAIPNSPIPDSPALPPGGRVGFRVVRNGTVIGSHELGFTRVADGFDIAIEVEMVVRFGPIALFRYRLSGVEQWRDGRMVHVSVDTNDDGTPNRMRADRDASGLWVEGSKAERYLAPPEAVLATHWNRAELDGPWINPQDGKLFHPEVKKLGPDTVALANGQSVAAQHYDISGDVTMQLWYDAAQQWTALLFIASDKSVVRYERT